MARKTLEERFWEKVDIKDDVDACWKWKANTRNGYGRVSVMGKPVNATKVSILLFYDIEVPEGVLVLHTCDNPPCVNPRHLFLGDGAANSFDMFSKGRAGVSNRPFDENGCCKNGHNRSVYSKNSETGRYYCVTCAKEHLEKHRSSNSIKRIEEVRGAIISSGGFSKYEIKKLSALTKR